MKLSKRNIIAGSMALLAGAGLVVDKMSRGEVRGLANDNKAKIAAILGSSTRSGASRISDVVDSTRRILKSDNLMQIRACGDNIRRAISPGDNHCFMAWDESGGKIVLRIQFGGINNSNIEAVEISYSTEISPGHQTQTTFTDNNGDGVFDICDVQNGETVSTRPCSPEDQIKIGSLLEIIQKM